MEQISISSINLYCSIKFCPVTYFISIQILFFLDLYSDDTVDHDLNSDILQLTLTSRRPWSVYVKGTDYIGKTLCVEHWNPRIYKQIEHNTNIDGKSINSVVIYLWYIKTKAQFHQWAHLKEAFLLRRSLWILDIDRNKIKIS